MNVDSVHGGVNSDVKESARGRYKCFLRQGDGSIFVHALVVEPVVRSNCDIFLSRKHWPSICLTEFDLKSLEGQFTYKYKFTAHGNVYAVHVYKLRLIESLFYDIF